MARNDSRARSRGRGGGGGDDAKIQALVDERTSCRRSRDFDTADRIRNELRDMGVNIDDTSDTWTGPGGSSGSTSGGAKGGGKGGGGGRGDFDDRRGRRSRSRSRGRGGGGADHAQIQALVDERTQCRRSRDFATADKIRDELSGMGVNIDDTSDAWTGPGGSSGTSGGKGGGKDGGKGGGKDRGGDGDRFGRDDYDDRRSRRDDYDDRDRHRRRDDRDDRGRRHDSRDRDRRR